MQYIIGLDFGNSYSFPCYIPELDISVSRIGGRPVDLIPAEMHYGYPSVFFYSKKAADRCRAKNQTPPPWCGEEAVKTRATPRANQIRNLKRHLQQPLRLDDWSGTYDDAIVAVIQYLVRRANAVLRTDTLSTTNQLSLSYPATYSRARCAYLKQLAERATLEDGTNVKVVGMIAEPAAAALDYLVENGRAHGETTVMTYDLGGGTFDLAVVTAYPEGKKNAAGRVYYYDIENTGGLEDLGGTEFDQVMFDLLRSKVPPDENVPADTLRNIAEEIKVDLSRDEDAEPEVFSATGESVPLYVTRKEFEAKAMPLVQKTIQETRRMLSDSKVRKPELIVLTGGASQMPMITRELERAFPEYQGKVVMFRPSKAISYGAARYGTPVDEPVQQRVPRDIGVRFYISNKEGQRVKTYIKAGTPLPVASDYFPSTTRDAGQTSAWFPVCEAKGEYPESLEPWRDWNEIMGVTLHFDRQVPKDTSLESRLVLDENALLTIEAREPGRPDRPVRNSMQLKL